MLKPGIISLSYHPDAELSDTKISKKEQKKGGGRFRDQLQVELEMSKIITRMTTACHGSYGVCLSQVHTFAFTHLYPLRLGTVSSFRPYITSLTLLVLSQPTDTGTKATRYNMINYHPDAELIFRRSTTCHR